MHKCKLKRWYIASMVTISRINHSSNYYDNVIWYLKIWMLFVANKWFVIYLLYYIKDLPRITLPSSFLVLLPPSVPHSFWGNCWHFTYSCSSLAFLIQYQMICMCVWLWRICGHLSGNAENPKQERWRPGTRAQGPKSQVSRVVESRVDSIFSIRMDWLDCDWD